MREEVASDEEKGIAAVVLCLGEGRRSIYLVLINLYANTKQVRTNCLP